MILFLLRCCHMLGWIFACSRWATKRYDTLLSLQNIKHIYMDEKLEERLGGQAETLVCYVNTKKRQMAKTKKAFSTAHVFCVCLQVQKEKWYWPLNVWGYEHTVHLSALGTLLPGYDHEGAVLRHTSRELLFSTRPRSRSDCCCSSTLFWWCCVNSEIIEIYSDKVWQYECSHLTEIKRVVWVRSRWGPSRHPLV